MFATYLRRLTLTRLPLLLLPAAIALIAVVVVAARCPAPEIRGQGVLEFGGREHSGALQDPQALGVNPLFTWAELEPQPGIYNWAPLDAVLDAAAANGKKVAPRVYTNAGDFHQATPAWVFEAGAAAYPFGTGSDTVQPVPTDPVFAANFDRFLIALGARYDGHPAIEFFQTNAAMGGYGEMVWSYGDAPPPPGWSPSVQIRTTQHWIDRWDALFIQTPLSLTVNPIGDGIMEELAEYAVVRGFYLQSNTGDQSEAAQQIFRRYGSHTRIVLEIEDNGCQSAQGGDFDAIVDQIFGYGFPIHYLALCGQTFADDARIAAVIDRLAD